MKNRKLSLPMIASIICIAIVLVDRSVALMHFLKASASESALYALLSIVMALVTLWYLVMGYKIPHGNALRMVFLLFTLYLAHHSTVDLVYKGYIYAGYSMLAAALIMSYVAGRLNKLEKNRYLLSVGGLFMFFDIAMHIASGIGITVLRIISLSSPVLLFVAIVLAYVDRYDGHRLAGINE